MLNLPLCTEHAIGRENARWLRTEQHVALKFSSPSYYALPRFRRSHQTTDFPNDPSRSRRRVRLVLRIDRPEDHPSSFEFDLWRL